MPSSNQDLGYLPIDHSLVGEWIVVASTEEFKDKNSITTRLDRQALAIDKVDQHYQIRFLSKDMQDVPVQTQQAYGFIWLCIGIPNKALFKLQEYAHPQARLVPCGAYGVRTSPLRAVENFLDMAHFPYVHTNILGAEPLTAVKPYKVEHRKNVDELWATECVFTQPLAAPNSQEPQETEYIYRVLSPLNVLLYKINTAASGVIPADVICLFIQPLGETQIRAHLLMILDDQSSDMTDMVLFQQKIFTQDKPILENHVPLTLPLSTRIEIPTRADAMATAYRKWLVDKHWTYGSDLQQEASV